MNPPPMDQAPSPLQSDAYLEQDAGVGIGSSMIANATPNYGSAPAHPPYAEMIVSAITSLKEMEGSSKKAIAKFIERAYPNLPAAHPALLTYHLKRLKNCGQLSMVKKSYILPAGGGSGAPITAAVTYISQDARSDTADFTDPSSSVKRRPGRPPKAKTPSFEPSAGLDALTSDFSPTPKRRGRPPKQPKLDPAASGLEFQNQMLTTYEAPEPLGSNTPVVGDSTVLVNGTAAGSSVKRGRGRPPKYTVGGDHIPVAALPPKVSGSGKPRGRPRKSQAVAALPLRQVPPASSGKMPRGRPRKRPLLALDAAANVPAVGIKRRGRPPSTFPRLPRPALLRVGRSRRPVGRPRKNSSAGALHVSGQSEAAANVGLTRKLEYMQLKVKNAVGLLKPHLVNANIIDILTAMQDLEELATMDITTPSTTEVATAQMAEPAAPTMAHETGPPTEIAAPLTHLSEPAYPGLDTAGQLPINFN